MALGVTVTGQASVERAYDTITDGAADMPAVQANVGAIATGAIRAAAPRRTGWLGETITARGDGLILTVSVGAVYGGVIEWGWRVRHIPGQHYAARGILASEAAITEAYSTGLDGVVADAQRGA